jgi:hypothetical protein
MKIRIKTAKFRFSHRFPTLFSPKKAKLLTFKANWGMMSRYKKIGTLIVILVLIALAVNFLGGGLTLGMVDEDPYAKLDPLSANAGSLSTFNLKTNMKSFTVSVPENILIIKDDVISANCSVIFKGKYDELRLLLPPTAQNDFDITITGKSFEQSFRVSVSADTYSLVSGDDYYASMRTFTTRYAKRSTGYPHMNQVSSYLQGELQGFGLETEIMSFEREGRTVLNVIGYHWGQNRPEEWIVLGGHYDIKEKTIEGAYDNAAGAIAVLEIAKAVTEMKTDRTVVFCLWSGEEQGLWGSDHFASNIPENVTIKTYLNYDMVGLNWPQVYQLNVLAGPDENANDVENPELINISNRVIANILQYPSSGFDVKETSEGSSDQASFWPHGIPTIYYAGLIVYPGYHNKADDLATMELLAGGRQQLIAGFETVVWVSYYTVLLLDNDEIVKQKEE